MKISGGQYKNRRLVSVKGAATRPTTEKVRQSVFNSIQAEVNQSRFLDLFAGSGAMGLEALSRGASYAVFIEKSKKAAHYLQKNIATLQVKEQTLVFTVDVLVGLTKLAKQKDQFEIIYADPPYYGNANYFSLLEQLDTLCLLKKDGLLFIETQEPILSPPLTTLQIEKKRQIGKCLVYVYRKREKTRI